MDELNYVLIIGLTILLIDVILRLILLRNELSFNRRKYDEEKTLRDKHQKWLKDETTKLKVVAQPLSVHLKKELTKDVTWLTSAMIQAKVGPDSKTLFLERLGHFEVEKKFIAEKFVPLLLARCKQHIEKDKKVCLLIDSGTTLYDFFEKLSDDIVNIKLKKQDWIDNVFVATNNLPGLQVAMEKGRINPNDRFSQIAFKCHLFPGEPLSIYAAVTGDVTIEALDGLKKNFKHTFGLKEDPKDIVFIGITVGNWIRIRRNMPHCPVPMARGKGHLAFKQKIVECSDEVFVIAPLGKVFKNVGDEEINAELGLKKDFVYPDDEIYDDLSIENDNPLTNPSKIKLVSTSRVEYKNLLFTHSEALRPLLKPDEGGSMSEYDIKLVNHIMFPFYNLPDNKYFEEETEFPHKSTRNSKFLRIFFNVHLQL
ncbi:MAG: hypothetical protein WCR42_05690 [bacterium]